MHEIRLRHPWEKRLQGNTNAIRIDVPEAESDSTSTEAGSATYQRNFNRPPGLAKAARAYLRIEAWQGRLVSLAVNDHPLEATSPPLMCEITEWLEPHNRIRLELRDTEDQAARLRGEVVLMIEE